ncbi:DUF2326 domain-containing protein [Oceanospirillum sediminis]|uniref:DUF2326 domain-containing protein n=1 Tax=Oceanospirillum sediminis TaxID=2760088 RepID=A0A839IWS3_9GAMM|nr:DUF2326 domain-containing protein [Oceanospirillum sediminis]MBB1489074.1 DUF2326 domain-containing protein [Oceanospirillum sediminis]
MQLNSLTVYKNGSQLRQVKFRKGLNIIVDLGDSNSSTGNSVGKSTLSRLVDYIFLSDGEDIYSEPEFGNVIPDVYEFIVLNKIIVELEFQGFNKKRRTLSRSLEVKVKECNYYVDKTEVTLEKYTDILSSEIFGIFHSKPSIRHLANRFVRNNNRKMQNTVNMLNRYVKKDEYDEMYRFLYGFNNLDLLLERSLVKKEISQKKNNLTAYRTPHTEDVLYRLLRPVEEREQAAKQRIMNFDFSGTEAGNVNALKSIRDEISELVIKISNVESKISYSERSISRLMKSSVEFQGKELAEIYSDAGAALSSELKRSYLELTIFHDALIKNKHHLIERDLVKKREELNNLNALIELAYQREQEVFEKVKEPAVLDSIVTAMDELAKIKDELASVKSSISKIEDTKSEKELLEKRLKRIAVEITDLSSLFDKYLEMFNKHFSRISHIFYGESYKLKMADPSDKKSKIHIANKSPNSTGGKKKGEISAFDFAYIDFINESQLKRPTFIFHDSIEDVDKKQILSIFEYASEMNGQYIVALLRDKIADSDFSGILSKSKILELSEIDKFFKI